MANVPEKLRSAAAAYLNNDAARWWVRDVTNSYGKLDLDGLYWLIDSDDRSVMVVERRGAWTPLAGEQGMTLASRLLAQSYGNEPWELMGLEKFCKTLASWFGDPRVHLTNDAFLRRQEKVIDSWLAGREKDPAAFRALRREAELRRAGPKWSLEFQAINRRGGIDVWSIEGISDVFRITAVRSVNARPDGTFYFPEEL